MQIFAVNIWFCRFKSPEDVQSITVGINKRKTLYFYWFLVKICILLDWKLVYILKSDDDLKHAESLRYEGQNQIKRVILKNCFSGDKTWWWTRLSPRWFDWCVCERWTDECVFTWTNRWWRCWWAEWWATGCGPEWTVSSPPCRTPAAHTNTQNNTFNNRLMSESINVTITLKQEVVFNSTGNGIVCAFEILLLPTQ